MQAKTLIKAKPFKRADWDRLVKEFEKEKEIAIGKAKFKDFCDWMIQKGYAEVPASLIGAGGLKQERQAT
jgi:hypothetical protein